MKSIYLLFTKKTEFFDQLQFCKQLDPAATIFLPYADQLDETDINHRNNITAEAEQGKEIELNGSKIVTALPQRSPLLEDDLLKIIAAYKRIDRAIILAPSFHPLLSLHQHAWLARELMAVPLVINHCSHDRELHNYKHCCKKNEAASDHQGEGCSDHRSKDSSSCAQALFLNLKNYFQKRGQQFILLNTSALFNERGEINSLVYFTEVNNLCQKREIALSEIYPLITDIELGMGKNYFKEHLTSLARKSIKKIVLAEGEEERILQAAEYLTKNKLVQIVLLGDPTKIAEVARAKNIDLSSPELSIVSCDQRYASLLYSLRKSKGMSEEEAQRLSQEANYFATLMVQKGDAHAMVSGAIHTTADTIRPALQIIKTKSNVSIVSSTFFMAMYNRIVLFADCAINPNPTAEQLADITISTVDTARALSLDPQVALLSYATGKSAKGSDIDLINATIAILEDRKVDFAFTGPIQYDAAVSADVGKIKLPHCPVAGHANIFIFPNLNAGNIGYKIAQREGQAEAMGPIL